MFGSKRFLLFILLILFTLFLRDLPYFNVLFIDKLWIFYFFLFLLFLFYSIKVNIRYVYFVCFVLFFLAFVFSLLRLEFFAHVSGIFIYFLLWIIIVSKIYTFLKEQV